MNERIKKIKNKLKRKNKWEVPNLSVSSSRELDKKSSVIEFLHNFKNRRHQETPVEQEHRVPRIPRDGRMQGNEPNVGVIKKQRPHKIPPTNSRMIDSSPSSGRGQPLASSNTSYKDRLREKWEDGKRVIVGPFGIRKQEPDHLYYDDEDIEPIEREVEERRVVERENEYRYSRVYESDHQVSEEPMPEDEEREVDAHWDPINHGVMIGNTKRVSLGGDDLHSEQETLQTNRKNDFVDEKYVESLEREDELMKEESRENKKSDFVYGDALSDVEDEEDTGELYDDSALDNIEEEEVEDEYVSSNEDEDYTLDLDAHTPGQANEFDSIENEDTEDYESEGETDEFDSVEDNDELEEESSPEIYDEEEYAEEDEVEEEREIINAPVEKTKNDKVKPKKRNLFSGYQVPGIDLLDEVMPSQNKHIKDEQVKSHIENVEAVIEMMKLPIHIESYEVGSRILKLKCPVKMSEYQLNKEKDFQRRIFGQIGNKDIRFEFPIYGHSNTFGIEVPFMNIPMDVVQMKTAMEKLEEDPVAEKDIIFPLGVDSNGNLPVADLEELVHCLVAGYTGSGKSVFLESIILTFLLRTSPENLKLVLVDPKHVEFSKYEKIPHLLTPLVTEPTEAALILNQMIDEMETRYRLFRTKNVKNLKSYNSSVSRKEKLPYVIIIIDELADLLMTTSEDRIDMIIARLAQKARAAGIHLIVATQRPSADVISSAIKTNLSTRVAFSLSSGIDSRTILDESGAEVLLGRGDMLLKKAGQNQLERIQGVYASEGEIDRVVEWVCQQAEPDFDEEFLNLELKQQQKKLVHAFDNSEKVSPEHISAIEEILDKYDDVKMISISRFQRSLAVGHSKAARIVDQLTERGLLTPDSGKNKGREIIGSKEAFIQLREEWMTKVT